MQPADLDGPEADGVPVLIVMSDNGPQLRLHSTRQFMAACAIMQRFGRPGTPTDQAWIESLFGHIKTEWPHLEKIRDAGEVTAELDRVRVEYNTVRLHAGIGYVTPTMSTTAAARASAKPAATASPPHDMPGSPTVNPNARTHHDRPPVLVGYFVARMPERLRHTSTGRVRDRALPSQHAPDSSRCRENRPPLKR